MKQLWILAWRNLWRNKRRSFITLFSVFFALFISLGMSSMQHGTWDHMIDSVVGSHTGYVQLMGEGYRESRSIDDVMEVPDTAALKQASGNIRSFIPRLESFALASSGSRTKGVAVNGIDVNKEVLFSGLNQKLIRGRFLQNDEQAVMLAEGLARYLELDVGDSLILLGQGYHGASAVGQYPIAGILKYGNPELNKHTVIMPLESSRLLYGTGPLLSTLVADLEDPYLMKHSVKELRQATRETYEVYDWEELMPELVQGMQADKASAVFMYAVIYLIVGFGIFSTVLMMTSERQHEFGVLLSIGMARWKLAGMVALETVQLVLVGILFSLLVTSPLLFYMSHNPIPLSGAMAETSLEYGFEPMYVFSIRPYIFYNNVLTVFIIALFVMIWPLIRILRLNPVDAMRN